MNLIKYLKYVIKLLFSSAFYESKLVQCSWKSEEGSRVSFVMKKTKFRAIACTNNITVGEEIGFFFRSDFGLVRFTTVESNQTAIETSNRRKIDTC